MRRGRALTGLVLQPDTGAFLQADRTLGPNGPLLPIVRGTGGKALLGQGLGKDVFHLVLAMDDKHPLGFGAERVHPGQQALAVGMTRKARQLTDLCLHVDGLTEQLDIDGAIDQGAPQRSHGLIAHKRIVHSGRHRLCFEVVADAACPRTCRWPR